MNKTMIKIRKAQEKDKNEILRILKDLDLYYPSQSLNNFWVAEKDGKIVGIVQLEEYEAFFFLRSLGIIQKHRKQGIATSLLGEIFKTTQKDIYLYTISPKFFEKFGFKVCAPFPDLPSKEALGCKECYPEKCVCMLKRKAKARLRRGKISP